MIDLDKAFILPNSPLLSCCIFLSLFFSLFPSLSSLLYSLNMTTWTKAYRDPSVSAIAQSTCTQYAVLVKPCNPSFNLPLLMPEFTTTTAYAPPIGECSYNLLAHNLRAGRLCVLSTVSDYVHPQLHSSTGPSSPTREENSTVCVNGE
ncbi:hypothetical protein FRC16_002612 [Serendipita sp. 398]|nr:hypothetical protein FRC16_002612 [Serendipita sp. 398]